MACIYMSQTSVMYHKARHIDTRVYHLRELCKDGALVLEKVSSAEQVADSLTKSTPKPAFEKHRNAMLGAQATSKIDKTTTVVEDGAKLRPDFASKVDEMEGIEQPEADSWGETESGFTAIDLDSHNGEVSKSKARWCSRGDADHGLRDSTLIRLIMVCFLLALYAMYRHAERYDYDDYLRLAIHYEQCMTWMRNAEFGEFHVLPPWERDINQADMQVEGG
eukprot:1623198-Rhodomonas_salina.1